MRRTELFHRTPPFPIAPLNGAGFLVQADALEFVRSLRGSIADVVFVDPPFNLGKDYGIASRLEDAESDVYEWYMRVLLRQLARVLKPGGALFLYHLPYWASRLTTYLQTDLEFRHWIAISMKNGFVRGPRLYPAHYAMLYYTKGIPAHFHRPKLTPQRCRHCGQLVKDYGGYREIIDKKGINLSDFWDDLSPVRHGSRKMRVANQLPQLLTDRVMEIAGHSGGVMVDPFMGTGTSLVSALAIGMTCIGNDIARESVRITADRIDALATNEPSPRIRPPKKASDG